MTVATRTTPLIVLAALLLLAAPALRAQTPARVAGSERAFTLRVPTGAFLPTGQQALAVRNAHASAVQAAWTLRPGLALMGTFAWTNSRREDLGAVGTPRLDVYTVDLGVERQLVLRGIDRRVGVSAFTGAGAGARRYDQRGPGVGAVTSFAGYAGTGGEVRVDRVALRLEVRDYVGAGTPLPGTRAGSLRNDVVVLAGLRLARRR